MRKKIKGLVLITGTTSGVGLNTLKPLLRFGWEIIAVNRSNKRAVEIAQQSLTDDEIKNIHFVEIDLSDLDDVRNGCREILKKFKNPINSIICNAAVYKPRLRKPERSRQGYENSMAVNHFGHFLLLSLLLDNILSSEREIDLNNRVPREAQGAQTLRLAGTFDQREERREEREDRQERRDDGRRDEERRDERERRDGRR